MTEILGDPDRAAIIGKASRALAEQEFELSGCADQFEAILAASITTKHRS